MVCWAQLKLEREGFVFDTKGSVWLKKLLILWVLDMCYEFHSVAIVNVVVIPFCYGVGYNVLKLKCIVYDHLKILFYSSHTSPPNKNFCIVSDS